MDTDAVGRLGYLADLTVSPDSRLHKGEAGDNRCTAADGPFFLDEEARKGVEGGRGSAQQQEHSRWPLPAIWVRRERPKVNLAPHHCSHDGCPVAHSERREGLAKQSIRHVYECRRLQGRGGRGSRGIITAVAICSRELLVPFFSATTATPNEHRRACGQASMYGAERRGLRSPPCGSSSPP